MVMATEDFFPVLMKWMQRTNSVPYDITSMVYIVEGVDYPRLACQIVQRAGICDVGASGIRRSIRCGIRSISSIRSIRGVCGVSGIIGCSTAQHTGHYH